MSKFTVSDNVECRIYMQNRVRVRNRGLKSGIELGLGFNSAALHFSLPDSILCLTSLFKPVIRGATHC